MAPFQIIRPPNYVTIYRNNGAFSLREEGEGRFRGQGVALDAYPEKDVLALRLRTNVSLKFLQLRWRETIPEGLRYLGDAWEQAPGNLEWRGMVPERPMPWYFLAYDGQHTHGVGVKTGASALCHWHVDPYGINLWLDVCNGGYPLQPSDREIHLADVVVRLGKVWEMPFQAARRFAATMSDGCLLPEQPVYGMCLRHGLPQPSTLEVIDQVRLLSDLAENTVNRPFYIVDGMWHDWSAPGQKKSFYAGALDDLASAIRKEGCRPGLCIRPLLSTNSAHQPWALPPTRLTKPPLGWVLDPTHPVAIEFIRENVAQAIAWGFDLLQYDFTTLDLLGEWPNRADGATEEGWGFYNPTLTTAEVLRHLYRMIYEASEGQVLLGGCNTVGHLAAGYVHLQRITEETCGQNWDRTRRVGINGLAFRGFHHGALYAVETDAVSLDAMIPWALNEQWLRLLSHSGTTCFVAFGTEPVSDVQRKALRVAFTQASRQNPLAEPLDWLVNTTPCRWKIGNETVTFDWFSAQYEVAESVEDR